MGIESMSHPAGVYTCSQGNRLGLLTGKHHFQGKNLMQELLENEGAIVEDMRIVNFELLFWDPVSELGL